MAEPSRLEALRRRVEKDPASIAFAQLAEEYRRAGEFERAVDSCRAGLTIHPTYQSARVTLGRALVQLGRLDEAQTELQAVVETSPDNVAAARALEEIHQKRERHGESPEHRGAGRPSRTGFGADDTHRLSDIPVLSFVASGSRSHTPPDEAVRALRTIAALEQLLDAVHVARAYGSA